jgi:uncharacterized membrane protein YdjX (TVP38/TMEM64 family)
MPAPLVRNGVWRAALAALAIVAVSMVLARIPCDVQAWQRFAARMPLLPAGIAYVTAYVAVTFFFVFGKDVFWLIGAALFGPALSAALIYSAELINLVILFTLARRFGREFVRRHTRAGVLARIDACTGELGFFWLVALRAVPLVPYRFQDLAAGLTRLSLRRYAAAAAIGSPLKIALVQYVIAVVGYKALYDPVAIARALTENPAIVAGCAVYCLLIIAVGIRLGATNNKGKTHGSAN